MPGVWGIVVHRFVLLTIDLILVATASVLALLLRDNLELSAARLLQFAPYLAITVLAALPVLVIAGLHRTLWRFSSLADYLRIGVAVVAIVLLAVALGFVLNRLENVARSLPILQGLLMMGALTGVRVATRLRHATRSRGPQIAPALSGRKEQETVLVVGLNVVTELFVRSVEEMAGERVTVAGLLGRGERHRGRLLRQYPVLGLPEEIEAVLADLEVHGVLVDRVVVTTMFDQLSPSAQAALLHVERTTDIQLDFLAERIVLNQDGPPKVREERSGTPEGTDARTAAAAKLDLEALAAKPYLRWKRIIDATGAAIAIACLAPVVVVVGLVVALDAGLPLIFWQQRPGLRGRPFRLYKFRTMAAIHDHSGVRLPDADRLSALGRLLRRSRLDELPQLYNILIGDMGFVGPRPLLPADQSAAFAARLAVRPGLTGWAQIKGGRELTASDKAALDIWYVRHASLGLDLKIVLGTILMIVRGERTDRGAIRKAWHDLGEQGRKEQEPPPGAPVDDTDSHLRKDERGNSEGAMRLTAPKTPHALRSYRPQA